MPDVIGISSEARFDPILCSDITVTHDPGLPTIFEDQPDFGASCDGHQPQQLCLCQESDPLAEVQKLTPVPASEEKAIVLYKSLSLPFFPGALPTGSQDLPIKVDTSFFQTQNAAGQFHGLPTLQDMFLISRPTDAINFKTSSDQLDNNNLQVVPWVHSDFPISAEGLHSPQDQNLGSIVGIEIEQIPVKEEDIVPMEEDENLAEHQALNVCMPNFSSLTSEIKSGVQLQHLGMPHPPFSPHIMSRN
eukprot:Gb_07073 [translate_table: standard]